MRAALTQDISAPVAFVLPGEFIGEGYAGTWEDSSRVRMDSWRRALTAYTDGTVVDLVFGRGTGSFAYLYLGRDRVSYPHNLLVEVLFENGLIGLLVLLSCLALPIAPFFSSVTRARMARDLKVRRVVAVSLAFYCYGLVHSQASGDLATNTWLPVAGVILVTVFAWIRWEARSTDVVAEDARRALRSA